MGIRTLVVPGIVLLSVWSCSAPPATSGVRFEVPVPAASADAGAWSEPRARIGPVFADDSRSQVPQVGAGPAYYQGPTGIAEGAIALVRGQAAEAQVAIFDARTGKEKPAGEKPAWAGPSAPKVSADGRYVTYVAAGMGRTELVLWDLELDQRVALPALEGAAIREVDLSGDGRKLIYLKGGQFDGTIGVFDRERGEERILPYARDRLVGVKSPTLSADGQTAAFVAASPRGDANIFVVNLATNRPISPPTLNSVDQDADPALDAKGEVLLFTSDRNGSYDLFAYHLKTGQYLDVGTLNSLADETLPRFLGVADAGLAYVSTRDGGPVAYMHPFGGWR